MNEENQIPYWIKDSEKLANLIAYLVSIYTEAHWRYKEDLCDLPDTLKVILGPPLTMFPTFVKGEEEHVPPWGIGIFMDIAHREMRSLAKEIGRKFLPEMEKHGVKELPPLRCPFSHLMPNLEGKDEVNINVNTPKGEKSVKVMAEKLLTRSYSIGAGSKGILSREPNDFLAIYPHTGSIFKAWENARDFIAEVVISINQQLPEEAHITAADINLDILRKPSIAAKAEEASLYARLLYNFAYIMSETNVNQDYANWVAQFEDKSYQQRLYFSRPEDVACAFYGFCLVVSGEKPLNASSEYLKNTADEMTMAETTEGALRILARPQNIALLREIAERLIQTECLQPLIPALQDLNILVGRFAGRGSPGN